MVGRLHRIAVALTLALLLAVPAHAEWESVVGSAAPALEIEEWLAAPEGGTLAELQGSVVVLLLPGAIDLADANSVARWNDVRAGWWAKGLRVIAVVNESPGDLPEGVEVSVAVGKASAYGSGEEARAVLIGADGTVAWEGEPRDLPEAEIAKLVRKAKPFPMEGAGDAEKAFRKGKLDEARTLAGADSAAAKRAAVLLGYWQRQAERATAAKCYGEASECLKRIDKHFGDAEEATAAAAQLKELKANKEVAKETSAAKAYAKLRQTLAKTGGKQKKIDALVKQADRAAKKKPSTVSVLRAARLAGDLRADPAIAALEAFIAKQKINTDKARWRNSLPKPPQVEFVDGKTYLWHLETNQGLITLRFFPDDAPMHVSNAIYLTLLGFYDGIIFQRVIPGFMAQGGCPDGSGGGQIGYRMDGEFEGDATHTSLGILSAANSGPGTDSSHFFITFRATPDLDGKHTVYGVMTKGEAALKKMEKLGSASGKTSGRIVIEKATVTVE